MAEEMSEVKVHGLHRIEVRDKKGNVSEAVLELRYRRIRVLPPIGKQRLYPALMLTVLYATERNAPKGRDRIDWKLVTGLLSEPAGGQSKVELPLSSIERYLLDQLVPDRIGSVPNNTLSFYLTKLARLGGYLTRAKDPPPGNLVIWRGTTRLTDIQLGFILGTQLVGN